MITLCMNSRIFEEEASKEYEQPRKRKRSTREKEETDRKRKKEEAIELIQNENGELIPIICLD